MQVLHSHWQPPSTPTETGRLILWAEDATLPAPKRRRGQVSKNPKPKPHPFAGIPNALMDVARSTGLEDPTTQTSAVILQLPTGRYGPHPSLQLHHSWDLSDNGSSYLAPWTITGLSLSPQNAITFLTRLPPPENLPLGLVLGPDCQYWRMVSDLVLEIMAAQKILPTLAQVDGSGKSYHARWLPILDGPHDGPRIAQLLGSMPALCRAETHDPTEAPAPRVLLDTFLNTITDMLARRWGQDTLTELPTANQEPAHHWLAALVEDDPSVPGSALQLRHLNRSYRAWLRNLYVAGDKTVRVAFRLEAPLQQTNGHNKNWSLQYALQARDDPSLLVMADQVWQTKGQVLQALNRQFEQPQEKLLTGLGYATRLFEPLKASLNTATPTSVALSTEEAFQFLREVAPLLESSGFGVLVPPWWNKPGTRLGVRLKLSSSATANPDIIAKSNVSFENLISYKWEITVGESTLTREEFEALVALKSPLVQIRGQWVQLDSEQIDAAIRFWEKNDLEADLSMHEAVQLGLGSAEAAPGLPVTDVEYDGWLAEWMKRFTDDEALEPMPQPDSLQAKLRPYQAHGFAWLDFMRRWGMGACLADDMGLGKTIQTITMLLYEQEQRGAMPGPVLLVCPTSVVSNWAMEVKRFAPTLTTHQHHGPDRLRDDALIDRAQGVNLILTSYAVVRRDQAVLQAVNWFGVILDEAQNIKNPDTKQAQAICALKAEFRLALTGTPVENRLSELWSIMQFLNPNYLGSRQHFRSTFALPIERYHDEDATSSLRRMTTPFILRRVKTDPTVIQDLPEKNEMKVYYTLSDEQATLYESVVQDSIEKVENSEGIERRGLVLGMLMKLKQICNHPAQFLHQIGSGQQHDPEIEMGRSGKLARLTEMLEEAVLVNDRSLIFTQFAEMGHFLSDHLRQTLGVSTLFLHGGVPAKKRPGMIERFQEDENGPPIFILSLKAGGTGLNLTRANHVFHFDRWWNPAVEDQATDRAFRIGQTRNVQVHKFVCLGTLEEMIDEMIESKKALADAVVGQGENWLTELSTADLREMVSLRKEVFA